MACRPRESFGIDSSWDVVFASGDATTKKRGLVRTEETNIKDEKGRAWRDLRDLVGSEWKTFIVFVDVLAHAPLGT